MREIPVYLINGFLESGKSTFLLDTLQDKEFTSGGTTLVIICEEGLVEFPDDVLQRVGAEACVLESQDELSTDFMRKCESKVRPDRVLIEFNGTWSVEQFLDEDLPEGWVMAQILTLVDASTFNNYWINMRSLMSEQLKYSETVIVNRCTEDTDRVSIRNAIKPLNRRTQIVYEAKDGVALEEEKDVPPFDISGNPIVISDDDFGLWYLDAMDHPERYRGKQVHFRALVYQDKHSKKDSFVPGRFAMTCCKDDIAYIGFVCYVNKLQAALVQFDGKTRSWVDLTAEVQYEYRKEYQGEGPVLYAKQVEKSTPPESEIVYFS